MSIFDKLNKSFNAGDTTEAKPIIEAKPEHHMSLSAMREARPNENDVDHLLKDASDNSNDDDADQDFGSFTIYDKSGAEVVTFYPDDQDSDKERMNSDDELPEGADDNDAGAGGSPEEPHCKKKPKDSDSDDDSDDLEEMLLLEIELFGDGGLLAENAPKQKSSGSKTQLITEAFNCGLITNEEDYRRCMAKYNELYPSKSGDCSCKH